MQNNEDLERARVVAEALTWQRTPYHHAARIKGVGCDCITLLSGVFEGAGLIPFVNIPYYPMDWHLHKGAERYLNGLLDYTVEIPTGQQLPGDIVIWRIGCCFSHGAIVVNWPTVIHAQVGRNVCLEDAEANAGLNFIGENTSDQGKRRPRRFFSYWRR